MNVAVQRSAIAVVQVFGLAVWFSMSAVVPSVRSDWGISAAEAVWLTGSVQIGFVVGALVATTLNLADRIPANALLSVSAASAAVWTIALATFVDTMAGAVPFRFLTGVCLAGVYPIGMKLMASWAPSSGRGRALGLLIAALTLGSTLPHLIAGLGSLPWRGVLLAASGVSVLGALVALTIVRPGPYVAASPPARNPKYVITMFVERGPRLVNLGYFGHMWELYALWTWLPMFLLAGTSASRLPVSVGVFVFSAMGLGGVVGCLLGGWGADRFGRAPTAIVALGVSGLCCLVSPLAFDAGPGLLGILCVVWGTAVIADSGVFSTSLSEAADPRYVGTALMAQTAIGFALTVVSIQLIPLLAELVGWQYAFVLLAVGPLVGVLAMRGYDKRPAARQASTEEER